MLGAMGREDLRAHPDWSRVEWRILNNAQVDRLVGDWVARLTVRESIAKLREADVPCGAVRTAKEAVAWEQLRARNMVQPLCRPDGTAAGVAAAGMPIKFSRSTAHHDAQQFVVIEPHPSQVRPARDPAECRDLQLEPHRASFEHHVPSLPAHPAHGARPAAAVG